MNCPNCGAECARDEADIGVGVIYGPWGCYACGWSEAPEYDSRNGAKLDGPDRVFDPLGGSIFLSPTSPHEIARVVPAQLVSDATYETWTPTAEDGHIIGEPLASRLASSESEPIAAFTTGRVVPNSDDPDSEGPK